MRDTISKIVGLVIFLFLVGGILYLNFFGGHSVKKDIYELIEISSNSLLPAEDYLLFTEYNDSTKFSELTLADVKGKFEEHPYVVKANVKFDGINKINVSIKEKELKAVILSENSPGLITEDYKLVPLLKNTSFSELPVISHLKINSDETGTDDRENEELVQAYKIIDAIKITDENIYKKLNEINLRFGRDVILTFSGLDCSVIFGRGNEAKKIIYLLALWKKMDEDNNSFKASEYIDLRYRNKIFIGKKTNTEITG
jgi:cell division protein FtsQ